MNPWHVEGNRKAQLNMVNGLLGKYERAIYVGAEFVRGGPKGLPIARTHAKRVDCWEIHRQNVDEISTLSWFDDIACIDVVDAVNNGWLKPYDLLVWYHGPGHLPYAKAIGVLDAMMSHEHTALVIGCPFGVFLQPRWIVEKNPHNEHPSWLLPEDFSRLGFEVSVCGQIGGKRAGILAWRIP